MNYLAQEAPFGGTGKSGLGVQHGPREMRKYASQQTIMVTRFEPSASRPSPTSGWGRKVFERVMVLMWGRRPRRRD